MSQEQKFTDRLNRIEEKRAQQPSPAAVENPPRRSEFRPEKASSGLFLGILKPMRLVGIVGFGAIAFVTLSTAGGIGRMSHQPVAATQQAIQAGATNVECAEIHHPLDLIRHQNNPRTASIPVCPIN